MLIYAVYRRTTYLEPSTNLNGEATISIQSVAYRMWRHRTNSHHTRQQVYKMLLVLMVRKYFIVD